MRKTSRLAVTGKRKVATKPSTWGELSRPGRIIKQWVEIGELILTIVSGSDSIAVPHNRKRSLWCGQVQGSIRSIRAECASI